MRWISLSAGTLATLAAGAWLVLRITSPLVTVTDAVEGPVVQAFYSTGTIQPVREFPIKSNTAGILTEVKVDKGDRVSKGQSLAIVSDPRGTGGEVLRDLGVTPEQLREQLGR